MMTSILPLLWEKGGKKVIIVTINDYICRELILNTNKKGRLNNKRIIRVENRGVMEENFCLTFLSSILLSARVFSPGEGAPVGYVK
jgi:hypothetical protein